MKKILAVMVLGCLMSCGALADQVWQGKPFSIVSKGLDLAQLFHILGQNYNVNVSVDDAVQYQFTGSMQAVTPEQVLARLKKRYSLVYYDNNHVFHVYKSSQMSNKVIPVSMLSFPQLLSYLQHNQVLVPQMCSVSQLAALSAVEVSGVPSCVANVSQTIAQLDQYALEKAQGQQEIKVFPLKYASANDISYKYRSQSVTVPGIVSILRNMNVRAASRLEKGKTDLTVFSADTMNNAVIVRTSSDEIPMYKNLIAQLDQKPLLINLSVSIIDVDAADLNQLGIDWAASAKIGGGAVNFNGNLLAGGSNFSTVLASTKDFLIKIYALEQHSKAKIVSQPSVITLNNNQAILDKSITFYTKLEGKNNVQLKSVSAGTLLRVTPRLIKTDHNKKMLLVIDIEDGKQDQSIAQAASGLSGATENLPEINNSSIVTQALLNAGQSLLLGGFVQTENTQATNKIPLLGDLPVLGRFFTSSSRQVKNIVRLFLIKAKPVYIGN